MIFKRFQDRLVEQQMHKPDACSWNISRKDVITDQISRHVDKCDVLRSSQHGIVRESLVSQTSWKSLKKLTGKMHLILSGWIFKGHFTRSLA